MTREKIPEYSKHVVIEPTKKEIVLDFLCGLIAILCRFVFFAAIATVLVWMSIPHSILFNIIGIAIVLTAWSMLL